MRWDGEMAGWKCYQWCCENTRVCRKGKEFLNVGGGGCELCEFNTS